MIFLLCAIFIKNCTTSYVNYWVKLILVTILICYSFIIIIYVILAMHYLFNLKGNVTILICYSFIIIKLVILAMHYLFNLKGNVTITVNEDGSITI